MPGALIAAVCISILPHLDPPVEGQAPRPPLSGPVVAASASAESKTLVRRGFNGEVEVLPVEADEAAIELLDLSPEQRQQFERLKTERGAVFSKAIRENLETLMKFAGVNPKEQPAEFLELMRTIGEALSEYRQRGTMLHEMAQVLDTAQRREVRSLVAEYVRARADAIRRQAGGELPAGEVMIRMHFETLGEMAKASIESAVAMGSAEFELIAQRLKLTPEQKSKIQRIFEPIAIQELQGKAVSPMAKIRVFFQVSNLLTDDQMEALGEYVREGREAPAGVAAEEPAAAPMRRRK